MNSIAARLTLVALVITLAFTVLAALGLQRAFEQAAEQALAERMEAELLLLMAMAEVDDGGRLNMPAQLPIAELSYPVSGRYAWILDEKGRVLWASPSTRGARLPDPVAASSALQRQSGHYLLQRAVEWELPDQAIPLRFVVAEDAAPLAAEVARFRDTLLLWLGIMAVVLSLMLWLALWLGLAPLRRAARQVTDIEDGRRSRLQGPFPAELQGLTGRINRLLDHQERQQERWRNALGDLAHSLKTPLAVIMGHAEQAKDAELREQAQRMDRIIQYQLQRAGRAGQALEQPRTSLKPVADRLLNTIRQVHADRGLEYRNEVPDTALVQLNEDDLMELLGNLLDNAAKWANQEVVISASTGDGETLITIEDDGPGIPEHARLQILQRGQRLDERRPGQGIGLTVAAEIATEAGGSLEIRARRSQGTRIEVRLPS
ncbi:MAG: histidine kinase [Gammaproteobacteria bacterium]|nr:MAG: histidine kinase [Gammaproteobacteria bacterium]